MMKKTFLFAFIFLLLILTVQGAETLTVIPPNDVFYAQNSNLDLHFSVVDNESKVLTVSEFTCFINVYDGSNNHLLNQNLSLSTTIYERETLINDSITKTLGEKPYNVFCNSSNGLNGYHTGQIFITRNGEVYDPALLSSNNSFLGFGFLGLGLIFLIISYLFKGEEKNVRSLRGLFFYMGIVHLLIVSLVIGSATNCESGLCGDINRFSGVGEVYVYIMLALSLYVLYTYGLARVTKVTESDNK